jgi:hypothetical protein
VINVLLVSILILLIAFHAKQSVFIVSNAVHLPNALFVLSDIKHHCVQPAPSDTIKL